MPWSSPGDLPDPGIKPVSPTLQADSLQESAGKSATLNMSVNLENLSVATGLENVSFHSNVKEGQNQRMFKNESEVA